MEKVDPYKHKQRLSKWEKNKEVNGLSQVNSKIVIDYLEDMKNGEYTARKKPLSAIRLNSIRQRIIWIINEMQKLYKINDIRQLSQKEATNFFNNVMRKGQIKSRFNNVYTSIDSYAFTFKAFWHWYMRRESEEGKQIKDITNYIDCSPISDNKFVYFTIDDLKKATNRAKYEYRVLMWFMFDSGIRSPTELMNIRISDISEDNGVMELNIRDSIAKTFGRKIKLMLSADLIKEYIKTKKLKDNDLLFVITPFRINEYLKRLFRKVFGSSMTKGGEPYNKVNMYDFRHASACYWLPRYKSESALKYRFGWKENNMIHHYSKLLGMKDTIEEKDLLLDTEVKTRLEKELERERQQRSIIEEKMKGMQKQMEEFKKIVKKISILDIKKKRANS